MTDKNRSPIQFGSTGSDLSKPPHNVAQPTLLHPSSHTSDGGTQVWDPDVVSTCHHLLIYMLILLPVLTIGDLLLNHCIPGSLTSNVKVIICAVIGSLAGMFSTMPRYVVTDEHGLKVKSWLGKARRVEWHEIEVLLRPRVGASRIVLTLRSRERVPVSLFGHPRDQRERLFGVVVFMAELAPCPNGPRKFIRERPAQASLPAPQGE